MINYFELAPSFGKSFPFHADILDNFGFEHGRLLAGDVNDWLGSFECSKTQRKGLRENPLWSNLKECFAAVEDAVPRCQIVGEDRPAGVVGADRLVYADRHVMPVWHAPVSRVIHKTSDEIISVVEPVLMRATFVKLIDPYFRNEKTGRFVNTGAGFVRRLLANGRYEQELEIHTTQEGGEELCKAIADAVVEVPRPFLLRVCQWPDRAFHNRYVLTPKAGFGFCYGLDHHDVEAEDLVFRLNMEIIRKLWQFYSEATCRGACYEHRLVPSTEPG